MKNTEIINMLRNDPLLRETGKYYVLLLDKALKERAFLVKAFKVVDNEVFPLKDDPEAEPEQDATVCFKRNKETGQYEKMPEKEDMDDLDDIPYSNRLQPEATVLDGLGCVIEYHLNRTRDGIIEDKRETNWDWPLVIFNVGSETIKAYKKKIASGDYLMQKKSASERKEEMLREEEAWSVLLNSPGVLQEVERMRKEQEEKRLRNQ